MVRICKSAVQCRARGGASALRRLETQETRRVAAADGGPVRVGQRYDRIEARNGIIHSHIEGVVGTQHDLARPACLIRNSS